jgi:hypothetical protein
VKCPRCSGPILRYFAIDGVELACLICGRSPYPPREPEEAMPDLKLDSKGKPPPDRETRRAYNASKAHGQARRHPWRPEWRER